MSDDHALTRTREACRLELLGMSHVQRGDFAEALPLLEQATVLKPDEPAFHNNLGLALKAVGKLEAAIVSFERALDIQPDMTDALLNLGNLLRQLRQTPVAARLRESLRGLSGPRTARYFMADVLTQEGAAVEADRLHRQTQTRAPGFVEAVVQLGAVFLKQGRVAEPLVLFEELVHARPEHGEAHAALAAALLQNHRRDEAERACRRALALQPDCVVAHNNLGVALTRNRQFQEAEASLRNAVRLAPQRSDVLVNLVVLLKAQGRFGEALDCVRKLLADAPERPDAHYYLASLKQFDSLDDPDLDKLQRLAAKPAPAVTTRLYLSFALGKAFDDLGRYELAFRHFANGNEAKCELLGHQLRDMCGVAERVMAVFRPELLAARTGFGVATKLPVFIVGMPRAGKSLVERLLARHPGVYAGGERGIVDLTPDDLGPGIAAETSYPEQVESLTVEQARRAAERHLALWRREAPEAVLFTNTMPGNYLHIGLIHLLFPEAPIIQCVRDPLDTCVACYFKLFHSGWDFTYDLESLARNYVAYRRVMRHWSALLPGRVLEVHYEELVADPRAAGVRIARHCGLSSEPIPASPRSEQHGLRRALPTELSEFHCREVGRWRRYEAQLAPLVDALTDLHHKESLVVCAPRIQVVSHETGLFH